MTLPCWDKLERAKLKYVWRLGNDSSLSLTLLGIFFADVLTPSIFFVPSISGILIHSL